MDAWMAAGRRAWGTALLLACARRRRKSAASSLHRPPTSMANTTRRQRLPAQVLGMCVLLLVLLPVGRGSRGGDPVGRVPQCWSRERPGSCPLPPFGIFFSCKICIKVFGTRALNILHENERSIGKVSVQDVCMVSWHFIFNFLIGGFRTNPV